VVFVCGKMFLLLNRYSHMTQLPKYIQQRRQGYYAVLEIPKALRQHFGRPRFIKSLETRDLKLAERRTYVLIPQWKAAIERAKGNTGPASSLLWEALEWRKAIEQETDGDAKENIRSVLSDRLYEIEEAHGEKIALEAYKVVSANAIPLALNVDAWLKTIAHLTQKTIDTHRRAVNELCHEFKTTQEINKATLKEYLLKRKTERDLSDQTIIKLLSFYRSFIGYLDETYDTALLPLFTIKTLGKTAAAKTAKQRAWLAFEPEDVSKLYEAVKESGKAQDQILADLIALGAYTGCRIEELGQIRVEHVTKESIKITDAKTAAGIREIPIHSAIAPLVVRLSAAAEDEFLIPAKAATYDKRTNALGTRFGRLKNSLGYGERHVFHSIRKTVVSQLEQAGINENITADIVGHEKPRITYGLYSSGTNLRQKAEALAYVTYAGALGAPT
jgi:integrase